MNAIVAVMNARAIALAADGVATLDATFRASDGAAVSSTAGKLFSVTPRDPIAAMVYGRETFLDVPWETVLTAYRRNLGRRTHSVVHDYAKDFAKFLETNTVLFPTDARTVQVRKGVRSKFLLIRNQMELTLEYALQHRASVNRLWVERALAEVVNYYYCLYENASPVEDLRHDEASRIVKSHLDSIRKINEHVFQDLPISRACRSQLEQLSVWFLTRFPLQTVCHAGPISGIVFAGFGSSEYFPSVVEMHLDGIVDATLRRLLGQQYSVSRANPAAVIAFAQVDTVQAFLTGIDPNVSDHHGRELRELWDGYTDILLKEATIPKAQHQMLRSIAAEVIQRHLAAMARWRDGRKLRPSLHLIHSLRRDGLAMVAEALLNLTLLGRSVSMGYTDGAPVDVCVLSKHDGWMWVKKKEYYYTDLRPGAFVRKHITSEELSNATKRKHGGPRNQKETDSVSFNRGYPGDVLPDTDIGSGATGHDASGDHDASRDHDAPEVTTPASEALHWLREEMTKNRSARQTSDRQRHPAIMDDRVVKEIVVP